MTCQGEGPKGKSEYGVCMDKVCQSCSEAIRQFDEKKSCYVKFRIKRAEALQYWPRWSNSRTFCAHHWQWTLFEDRNSHSGMGFKIYVLHSHFSIIVYQY